MSIYLDYQATTPLDPAVREVMLPYLGDTFGNPHSEHRHGWTAAAGLDMARRQVAELVGAAEDWTVFTSGATEANNLALKGVLMAGRREGALRNRLITVATEHSCVLETARWLNSQGFPVTILPVDADGLISFSDLDDALGDDVALVSVMAVNNEIGVIQPLAQIGERVRAAGALFHSDIAQGFGKMPIDVERMNIDLLSLSAHKIYGPKGIGALLRRPGLSLEPQMHGGGQEGEGLRSGTLAPALIAGLGKAAEIAAARMSEDQERAERHWTMMLERLPKPFQVNGSREQRWKGNLNVAFGAVDGSRLIADLRRLSVSSGAACASRKGERSHVLEALGLSRSLMKASLRMGWGRFTTDDDIKLAADMIDKAVTAQRRMAA